MPSERPCEVCGSARFSALFDKHEHHFVRCDACALERIDPQPSDETLAAIYGKHYYDAWGLHRDEDTVSALKRGTFSYVFDQLPKFPKGTKLLDCGAATGFLMDVASERGFDCYGLELSEFGATEIARKFGKERVFRGELENASFKDVGEGFQIITMCDYIEHVRAPHRILELAFKLLAPGGVLAITTPNTGSLSHRILSNSWSHYKVEHLFYFRPDNLQRLLLGLGFSKVEFKRLWKSLTIDYITHQFQVYPHPVLSPIANGMTRVLPSMIGATPLRFLTGELLAFAQR